MNDIIKYDFTTQSSSQSMNPIGLTFNFYNRSLFKEVDQDAPGKEGPLHEPKDKNMNYAHETAPYHSGAVAGKMESTVTADKPIKKKEVKTKDMYEFLQGKLQDMHQTLFDTGANVINNSHSPEQKFENVSGGNGLNTSVTGNSQPLAYRPDIADIDNPHEYDFAKEKESYIGFLQKYYEKMANKLQASDNKTVTLKADGQKKPVPHPDHEVDISPASQYAWSKNTYGSFGAEGSYPVSY